MDKISEAIIFATQKHSGQLYDDFPYVTHPLQVFTELKKETKDVATLVAAILHDIVEDTDTSLDDIEFLFGDEVSEIVESLTRRPDELYNDYILRVLENKDATLVKFCDLKCNLENDGKESLKTRYSGTLIRLQKALGKE